MPDVFECQSTQYLAASFASFDEMIWRQMKDFKNFILARGWTTRGSSIGSGLYSATPDGVDHWADVAVGVGLNGANRVWHVFESDNGCQLCVEVNGGGGSAGVHFSFSINKFETGGAWRNGGSVAYNVRPTDTASSPASGREIAPTADTEFWPSGFADSRMFFWSRTDHKVVGIGNRYAATGATATDGGLFWLSSLTQPANGDDNPYLMLHCAGAGAGFSAGNYTAMAPTENLVGRVGGSLVNFSLVTIGRDSTNDVMSSLAADPFTSGEIEVPMVVWTPTAPKYVRMSIPNLYRIRSGLSHPNTFNSRTRLIIGEFSFPWALENLGGTDVVSTVTPLRAFITNSGSAPSKALNLGLESGG